ncbi:MAG: GNAT family N-acetyltransferase [Candidatus Atribacteria bacterium]|nr:GNAT family N-acetyltransferase [Candidatus Atribacteria bacterium]
MPISINKIQSASPEEWDRFWLQCDYSTYFHSKEWAEIWKTYTFNRIQPDPQIIFFSDGKKALLPFSYTKQYHGILKNYISSPGGTFGGWISGDILSKDHIRILLNYIKRKHKNIIWRINPYNDTVGYIDFKISKNDETYVLSLSNDFESIFKNWTKGHKSAAKKAKREGVIVTTAATLEHWKSYYHVYEDSLRRWGEKVSSKYTWDIFEKMYQLNSRYIKLWIAEYNKEIISGALCFYAKKHVVYWHGASLEKYFYLRSVNLILYEAIKDACDKRYRWFDFNPSGGHEGVKSFKKSFGGQPLQSDVIINISWINSLLPQLKRCIKKVF